MKLRASGVNLVELSDNVVEALNGLPELIEFVREMRSQRSSLTLVDAARRARRRTADVRDAIDRGELPAQRSGRAWSIIAADVDKWAKERRR